MTHQATDRRHSADSPLRSPPAPSPPMTPHQFVAARIAETSRAAVAADIGITERDLRDFMTGIALAAMPAMRLGAWVERHLTPEQGDAPRIARIDGTAARGASREATPAPPRAQPRRDSGWAFVRSASGEEVGLPAPRPRRSSPRPAGAARPAPPGIEIETIREYVRERVHESSEREVLADIGAPLGRGSLRQFLDGSTPRPRILAHLADWYERAPEEERGRLNGAWRSVPASTLRAYYSAEVERLASQRAVARAAGISISALQNFLGGATPTQARVLRPLALLYLSREGRFSDPKPAHTESERDEEALGDEPDAPWRNVGIDLLRAYIDAECTRLRSRAAIAGAAAVPLPSLRSFLAGETQTRPWVLRALARYYLEKGGRLSDPPPPRPIRAGRPPRDRTAPSPEVEALRAFVRERVDESSVREVAAEIGPELNQGTLHQFLQGSTPQQRNLSPLAAWHERVVAEQREAPDAAWRDVPLATLRTYFAAEVERVPVRAVARAATVSVATLQQFLAGDTVTRRRVVRRLALLYLSRGGQLSDPRHRRGPGLSPQMPEDEADAPWRSVPLETLRTYVAAECKQLRSRGTVARAAGVSLKALRNFLADRAATRPWVVRALALYYLEKDGQLSEPPARPSRPAAVPRPRRERAAAARQALPGVDVEQVRAFARDRVDETSVGKVLAEIGPPLKRTTFHQFLGGSTPHVRNLAHLAAWHARVPAEEAERPGSPWRDVPVPTLRTYYAAEVERVGSRRAVARAAVISIDALQRFLAGEAATRRSVQRRLALLYLSRDGRLSDPVPGRPDPVPGVDIEKIRRFVRARVDESSVREVLAEIGPQLKKNTLHKFLNGSSPHGRTLAHLAEWHERVLAEEGEASAAWRAVPVATLRTYYAAEAGRLRSRRAVARAVGISTTALQEFLTAETVTQRRILRPLALLYLSRDGRLSDPPRQPNTARAAGPVRPKAAAGDQEPPDEFDDLPVEILRHYITAECRQLRSRAAVARAAGVSHKGLGNFLAGRTETRPWVLRAFARYYLERGGELSEPPAPGQPRPPRGGHAAPLRLGTYTFPFPGEEIREYIRRRVELTSQRFVLSQIHAEEGLAEETVLGFLDGSSTLTEHSAQRLASWFSRAFARAPVVDGSMENRRVPVDELHRFYVDAVRGSSVAALAAKVSVGIRALEQFLAKAGRLQPRTRRNLTFYYLTRRGVPEDDPLHSICQVPMNSSTAIGKCCDPEQAPGLSADPPADASPVGAPVPPTHPEAGLTPEQHRINSIRVYARLRAAAKTTRVVADEVGLNFSTFYNFLRGNDPRPQTQEKLEAWYDRDSATADGAATLRDQLLAGTEGASEGHAVSAAALRSFFAAALTRGTTTPHSLADDARVSPIALQRFLAGDEPGKETLSRLQSFYADHAMRKAAALDAILEDLDGYVRTRARRRVLSSLARGYKEAGVPTSGWVEFLMAQWV